MDTYKENSIGLLIYHFQSYEGFQEISDHYHDKAGKYNTAIIAHSQEHGYRNAGWHYGGIASDAYGKIRQIKGYERFDQLCKAVTGESLNLSFIEKVTGKFGLLNNISPGKVDDMTVDEVLDYAVQDYIDQGAPMNIENYIDQSNSVQPTVNTDQAVDNSKREINIIENYHNEIKTLEKAIQEELPAENRETAQGFLEIIKEQIKQKVFDKVYKIAVDGLNALLKDIPAAVAILQSFAMLT